MIVKPQIIILIFQLKGQPIGDYSLEVKSFSGNDFKKAAKLNMNAKTTSVFVQTDKAIYKPADTIQFRVLVLSADMKPLDKPSTQIYFTDGAYNRVKQFKDVAFIKGVFQSELQLSDLPVIGTWKIHVKVNEESEATKEFEVAEYTLPKFEVKIDTSPDVSFKEGKIKATVKAKYTFGKIAKGNATVTGKVLERIYGSWTDSEHRKVSKSIEVNGKGSAEFDFANDFGIKDNFHEKTVELSATFKDELTEREVNATASVIIHTTPHKIELTKSSETFKIGLPFSITAIVKYHDKNAPVNDEHNRMIFTVKYFNNTNQLCRRYDEYDFGYEYKLPYGRCRERMRRAFVEEVPVKNGLAKLNLEASRRTSKIRVVARYLDTASGVISMKRQESINAEYIQLKLATEE